ncbi:MAG: hypothetical protein HQL15_05705, partial [Candidatus Omnitrophica bacterium]|nr:hypothetical protein [Candidatus Omnitrophota bacterium]
LQAFKKGVYNYIKEEPDPATNQTVPRKYFSGGCKMDMAILAFTPTLGQLPDAAMKVDVNLDVIGPLRDKGGPKLETNGFLSIEEEASYLLELYKNAQNENERSAIGWNKISIVVHKAPREFVSFFTHELKKSKSPQEIYLALNILTDCLMRLYPKEFGEDSLGIIPEIEEATTTILDSLEKLSDIGEQKKDFGNHGLYTLLIHFPTMYPLVLNKLKTLKEESPLAVELDRTLRNAGNNIVSRNRTYQSALGSTSFFNLPMMGEDIDAGITYGLPITISDYQELYLQTLIYLGIAQRYRKDWSYTYGQNVFPNRERVMELLWQGFEKEMQFIRAKYVGRHTEEERDEISKRFMADVHHLDIRYNKLISMLLMAPHGGNLGSLAVQLFSSKEEEKDLIRKAGEWLFWLSIFGHPDAQRALKAVGKWEEQVLRWKVENQRLNDENNLGKFKFDQAMVTQPSNIYSYEEFGAMADENRHVSLKDVEAFTLRMVTPQGELLPVAQRRSNKTFGITEVAFVLQGETRQRMVEFQQALKQLLGKKVYLVDENKLHLTTQGLEQLASHSGLDQIDLNEKSILDVRNKARSIETPAFKVQVSGLNFNPQAGIFWELKPYATDLAHDPVYQRRNVWESLGVSKSLRPPHITAAYLTQELTPTEQGELRNLLNRYSDGTPFRDLAFDQLNVIAYSNFAFNASSTEKDPGYVVLESVPLKKSLQADDEAMTTDAMQRMLYPYLKAKGMDLPDQELLPVKWIGRGMLTKVIGFNGIAYRIINAPDVERENEEAQFRILGKEGVSPRLLGKGWVVLEDGQPHRVFEVEEVIGQSIEKYQEGLDDQDIKYLEELIDYFRVHNLDYRDLKPENIVIGSIRRQGKLLPRKAYAVDVSHIHLLDIPNNYDAHIDRYLESLKIFRWERFDRKGRLKEFLSSKKEKPQEEMPLDLKDYPLFESPAVYERGGVHDQAQLSRSFDEEHVIQSKKSILKGAENVSKDSVTVLGVGSANDIPLLELCEMFDKVNLVDIDPIVVQRALAKIPADAVDFKGRLLSRKIKERIRDITGGQVTELKEKALKIIKTSKTAKEAENKIALLFKNFKFTVSKDIAKELKASYVVSSVVATQLGVYMYDSILKSFTNQFQQKVTLGDPLEKSIQEINQKILSQHMELLWSTLNPAGKVYFSVDAKRLAILGFLTDEKYAAITDELKRNGWFDRLDERERLVFKDRFRSYVQGLTGKYGLELDVYVDGTFESLFDDKRAYFNLSIPTRRYLLGAALNLVVSHSINFDKEKELIDDVVNKAKELSSRTVINKMPSDFQPTLKGRLEVDQTLEPWQWINNVRALAAGQGGVYEVEGYMMSRRDKAMTVEKKEEELIGYLMGQGKDKFNIEALARWGEEQLGWDSNELFEAIRRLSEGKRFKPNPDTEPKKWTSFLPTYNEDGTATGDVSSYWALKTNGGNWHKTVHTFILSSQGKLYLQIRSDGTLDASAAGGIDIGLNPQSAAVKEAQEELELPLNPNDLRAVKNPMPGSKGMFRADFNTQTVNESIEKGVFHSPATQLPGREMSNVFFHQLSSDQEEIWKKKTNHGIISLDQLEQYKREKNNRFNEEVLGIVEVEPQEFMDYYQKLDLEGRKAKLAQGFRALLAHSYVQDVLLGKQAMTIREMMEKQVVDQWESVKEARSFSGVLRSSSIDDKYNDQGKAKPFHGLTTGIWFEEEYMKDFHTKLINFQNKFRKLLEKQGIDHLFAFPSASSLHLTINDLLTTSELISRNTGNPENQRQWPDELIRLSKKFNLKLESPLPFEIEDFVVKKVQLAFQEISSRGLGELAFESRTMTTRPGRNFALVVFPKDGTDDVKIARVREIIFQKTGIKLDNFFGHITLAFQVKDMSKEQYEKYYQVLQQIKDEKIGGFIAKRLELRAFSELARFENPLKTVDLVKQTGDFTQTDGLEIRENKIRNIYKILQWLAQRDDLPQDYNLIWIMGSRFLAPVEQGLKLYNRSKPMKSKIIITGGIGRDSTSMRKLNLAPKVQSVLNDILDEMLSIKEHHGINDMWDKLGRGFHIRRGRDAEIIDQRQRNVLEPGHMEWIGFYKTFLSANNIVDPQLEHVGHPGEITIEEHMINRLIDPSTREDSLVPEALVYYAQLISEGVDPADIVIDAQSTTGLENVTYGAQVLNDQKILPKNIVLVQIDDIQRRAKAALQKQLPKYLVQSNGQPFAIYSYAPRVHSLEDLGKMSDVQLNDIQQRVVGELTKFASFYANGSIVQVEIPQDILQASDALKTNSAMVINGNNAQTAPKKDQAMTGPGGIDLTSDKAMQVQSSGEGIQFHIDSAQLAQLQNASGFSPIIVSMQRITDIKGFLMSQ